MKYLCVNTEGGLEIWERDDYWSWMVQLTKRRQDIVPDADCWAFKKTTPEFWGREILEEWSE